MTLVYPLFGDVARLCPSVAACVPQRFRQLPSTPPEHIAQSQSHHEGIAAAIEAHDAILAGRLMTEHVLATRDRLHKIATRRV